MEQAKKVCPTCQGKKVVEGICECSMEWRGNQGENEWEDCRCTPDQECVNCHGTGYVESQK